MTTRPSYSEARRAKPSARRVLAVLVLATVTGCGDDLQDPGASGGHRVVSIEGLVCEGPRPIVFSPDGTWLIIAAVRESRDGALPRRELALFRPGRGEWTWPGPADEPSASRLAAGRSPRTERACWSDTETVHFPVGPSAYGDPAKGADASGQRLGFLIRLSQPDQLRFGPVPNGCRRPAWSQWRYESPDPAAVAARQRIDAIQIDEPGPAIRLVAGDGRVIATHSARNVLVDHIVLAAYAWSPDGSTLAYLLSENVGSLGRPNRLWRVRRAIPEPELLATGIYSIQWRDERTLFGCGRIGGERALSVIRWTADD